MNKSRGRPKDHSNPLDPLARAATLATLRFLSREKKLKVRGICDQLGEFGDRYWTEARLNGDTPDQTNMPKFDPDDTTVNRALNNGNVSDALVLALNLWLSNTQPHLYTRHLHEERIRANEPFVRSARAILGGSDKLDLAKIRRLQGRFRLIRPFHLDPRRKAIAELFEIGTDTSPYECRLVASFENEHGRLDRTEATGRFVPHAYRAIALLGHPIGLSHLILHFDDITPDSMRGIVIASVGTHPSSAYPFRCLRLDPGDDFGPHVLSKAEVERLPTSVRQVLDRGSVYWNSADFAPWIGKP